MDRARERSSPCRHPYHRAVANHAVFNVGCMASGRAGATHGETCLDTCESRLPCPDRLDVAGDDGDQLAADRLGDVVQLSVVSQPFVWAVLYLFIAAADCGMLQLFARI